MGEEGGRGKGVGLRPWVGAWSCWVRIGYPRIFNQHPDGIIIFGWVRRGKNTLWKVWKRYRKNCLGWVRIRSDMDCYG